MADSMVGGAFDLLIKIGFLNLIVPFILFYAIVFGMLEKTQLFSIDKKKEEMRSIHSLIAFALSITATAASYAVGITQNFLPILGIASVVLLGFMMVLGMAFGPKFDESISSKKEYRGIIFAFAIIVLFAAVVIIGYNGLIVGTPCNDPSLTPVNTLNPGPGECTKFSDFSKLDEGKIYLMGIEVMGLMGRISPDVIGYVLTFAIIGFIIYYITKKSN
ncbi:MAG: hypothetical protein PHG04_03525 [Candidatus Nanoarchaeia archaeon]|nr:hypothetical protein [Candidatus Nanoarchaeia archaeon]MDD5054419.1 hypothetical protein [Candidatus Nanoarchaeia archaeon]